MPLHSAWLVLGQLVAHPLPSLLQPYSQAFEDEGVQAPLPLHTTAVVAVLFVQPAAAPHDVLAPG